MGCCILPYCIPLPTFVRVIPAYNQRLPIDLNGPLQRRITGTLQSLAYVVKAMRYMPEAMRRSLKRGCTPISRVVSEEGFAIQMTIDKTPHSLPNAALFPMLAEASLHTDLLFCVLDSAIGGKR